MPAQQNGRKQKKTPTARKRMRTLGEPEVEKAEKPREETPRSLGTKQESKSGSQEEQTHNEREPEREEKTN